MPVRVVREAGFAFPARRRGAMWTSWMARILASHDEADYAARHALPPGLGEMEDVSPSPLAGEGRGEGYLAAAPGWRRGPLTLPLRGSLPLPRGERV
jgi:hypothetical protein